VRICVVCCTCTYDECLLQSVFFSSINSFALRVRHNTNSACILGVFRVADAKRIYVPCTATRYAVAKRPNYHNIILLLLSLLLLLMLFREKYIISSSGRTQTRDCNRHAVVVVVGVRDIINNYYNILFCTYTRRRETRIINNNSTYTI
jgi:hypothetical protein